MSANKSSIYSDIIVPDARYSSTSSPACLEEGEGVAADERLRQEIVHIFPRQLEPHGFIPCKHCIRLEGGYYIVPNVRYCSTSYRASFPRGARGGLSNKLFDCIRLGTQICVSICTFVLVKQVNWKYACDRVASLLACLVLKYQTLGTKMYTFLPGRRARPETESNASYTSSLRPHTLVA